jgi:hypothetical protein
VHETGRRTDDAKQFVRHLFELGGTDANTATACLLALDRQAKGVATPGRRVVWRRRSADWSGAPTRPRPLSHADA